MLKNIFNTLRRRPKSTILKDPESAIISVGSGSYRVDLRDAFLIREGGSDARALDIYYNLMTDPTVYVSMERLNTLIYNMDRKLKPGGEEEVDRRCFEHVKKELERKRPQIRKAIDTCVMAHLLGVTWSEIITYAENGYITFDIVPADSRRIGFTLEVDEETGKQYYQPRIKVDDNLYPGDPVPDRRFIIHRYYTVPIDSPYGLGIGQQLWWLVEFKKAAMQIWNKVSSRHSSPMVIGTVPDNTDTETVDDFFTYLQEMADDNTFVIPDDFSIILQNADTKNADVLIKDLIDYCDNKIREIILGESSSSSTALKPGLAGAARDARAITMQKAKRIADDINDTINNSLIAWICNRNFPEAKPPYLVTENTDNEQLSSFVQNAVSLAQLGYEIDPAYIERRTGYPRKTAVVGLGEGLGEPPMGVDGSGGLGETIEEPPAMQPQEEYYDSRSLTNLNPTN